MIEIVLPQPGDSAGLLSKAQQAVDTTFKNRVTAGVVMVAVKVGLDVLSLSSPSPVDKSKLELARRVLVDMSIASGLFVPALVVAGYTSANDDLTLVNAVQDLWGLIAKTPI